jgi:hypothetical protein
MFEKHTITSSPPSNGIPLRDVPPGTYIRWKTVYDADWQYFYVPCEWVVHKDFGERVAISLADATVISLARDELAYPLTDGEVLTIVVKNSGRGFVSQTNKDNVGD